MSDDGQMVFAVRLAAILVVGGWVTVGSCAVDAEPARQLRLERFSNVRVLH